MKWKYELKELIKAFYYIIGGYILAKEYWIAFWIIIGVGVIIGFTIGYKNKEVKKW